MSSIGSGDAEVNEVGEVELRNEDVRRFDVAMHQSDLMGGVQRGGNLVDDHHGAGGVQRTVGNQVMEVATLDQTHVHVEAAVDLTEPVDRHDVGIAESRRGVRLSSEPPWYSSSCARCAGKNLQRDGPVGCRVVSAPDLAHPPRPSTSRSR